MEPLNAKNIFSGEEKRLNTFTAKESNDLCVNYSLVIITLLAVTDTSMEMVWSFELREEIPSSVRFHQEPSSSLLQFLSVQFHQRGNYQQVHQIFWFRITKKAAERDFLELINWPINSDIFILLSLVPCQSQWPKVSLLLGHRITISRYENENVMY